MTRVVGRGHGRPPDTKEHHRAPHRTPRRSTRRLFLLVLSVLALGLAACESDTAGGEAGADVGELTDQVAAVEEQVAGLEERVAGLEEGMTAADAGEDPVGTDAGGDVLGLDQVYNDFANYVGTQVTVSAEVGEIISTNAFTLTGPVNELLVVSASGAGDSAIIEPSAPVQVTGTVREGFDIAAYEQETGLDLDDELFQEWTGENYIAADSVSEPSTDIEETTPTESSS